MSRTCREGPIPNGMRLFTAVGAKSCRSNALWEALRPHAPEFGTYVNAITEVEDDRVRLAFGPEKYERLAAIKATYDPNNVFRRNPKIKPV